MKINPKANLKLQARKWFEICIIASIILHLVLFMSFKEFESGEIELIQSSTRIEMDEIPETEQINRPPPPQAPTVPVESEDEELLDDITIDDTVILNFATFKAPPPPPPVEEDNVPAFLPDEDQPKLIGGVEAITKVLKYPPIALLAGTEGSLTINVFVNEKGEPVKTEIIKTNLGDLGFNEAAHEAIMQQKFIPAKQRDRACSFWIAIPIIFKIKK